jgi:hypothetical protein
MAVLQLSKRPRATDADRGDRARDARCHAGERQNEHSGVVDAKGLVRSPEITDAQQIARTINDSWRVGYRGQMSDAILDGLDDARGTTRWARWLRHGYENAGLRAEFRVTTDAARQIVGVSAFGADRDLPNDANRGELWTLYVAPQRGCRERSEIALVMPLPVPIPPSPAASEALLAAFAQRGISWHPETLIRALDPDRRTAVLAGGDELPYDLFLGVPVHRTPAVVVEAGMTVDGWIPVDPLSLETRFPGVYAVGDVTSVGTPKAGVFAEGQAAVVAERILARARGQAEGSEYGGRGVCYLEFGEGRVAGVDVTFLSGRPPTGGFEGPSEAIAADKVDFGTSRIRRWFGREWAMA